MTVTVEQLVALQEKYRTLITLRETRDRVQAEGAFGFDAREAAERRATMKALAARFPGSLRELEHSTALELQRRLAALEMAQASGASEPWMEATALFHEVLRETLRIRRCSPSPERDPSGRLLTGVWSAVSALLGVTSRQAEMLVYPHSV